MIYNRGTLNLFNVLDIAANLKRSEVKRCGICLPAGCGLKYLVQCMTR